MTWTRISDTFTDQPNVLGLSDAAFRAHIEALVWSNRQLTDGRIPAAGLRRIASAADTKAVVAELLAAGMWQEDGDAYELDWADQESRENVEARRTEWARRAARQRLHNRGDHSTCDPKRCRVLLSNGVTRDSPSDSPRDPQSESAGESSPSRSRSRSRPIGRERGEAASAAPSAGATGAARREDNGPRAGFTVNMPGVPS